MNNLGQSTLVGQKILCIGKVYYYIYSICIYNTRGYIYNLIIIFNSFHNVEMVFINPRAIKYAKISVRNKKKTSK